MILGARGRVCLEPVLTPPDDAPQASWRVLARWTGQLPPGSVITVADRRLVVLRVLPMEGRRAAAHLLCREEARVKSADLGKKRPIEIEKGVKERRLLQKQLKEVEENLKVAQQAQAAEELEELVEDLCQTDDNSRAICALQKHVSHSIHH